MADVYFPRTIDEPPYFMLWRIDDAMVPIFGLLLGNHSPSWHFA